MINPEFARRLGRAAGGAFAALENGAPRSAVVGRDTRASGIELEDGVVAGLAESGIDVLRIGVAPTPAVALAAMHFRTGMGVVVTASHNPADDNGIKFFSGAGLKLTDEAEAEIEVRLDHPGSRVAYGAPGVVKDTAGLSFYEEKMARVLPPGALSGWKIVLDTANGAAFRTAPAILAGLGARFFQMGDSPDGRNINEGLGSQHPEAMGERVRAAGADLGIALDGDGDRLVLADENGSVLSGDELLTVLALSAMEEGRLAHNTLVVTEQSNLGVDEAVGNAGGRVERTGIGDRHVIARMRSGGFNLGGESSGHILFPELSPAGDGMLAVLKTIEVMLRTGRPLSELRRALRHYPQVTSTLRVGEKPEIGTLVHLTATMREARAVLGNEGRVFVRYSGTEPKLRLLVEGREEAVISKWMTKLRESAASDGLG